MLDMSIEAMTPPPRKRRHPHGIGSSELALAMLTFGEGDAVSAPRWMREKAKASPRFGCPFWVAQKLGIAAPDKGATQDRGTAREPELLDAWIAKLERDEWSVPAEREVDPDSVQWWGALPKEFPPLRDRLSPIASYPDGWARTWAGELVLISIKCARYGYSKPAWWNGITEAPWYYAVQQHGEHAVISAKRSIVVVGCGWNRDEEDPRSDGPLLVLTVDRDAAEIERARDVARRAWALVEPRIART